MQSHSPEFREAAICVWIVEDHTRLRNQLVYILNKHVGLRCPQDFADFEALQNAFERIVSQDRPDVILMDIELPGQSGIEAIPWLRKRLPDVPIVMLTIHDDEEEIHSALREGAAGYLLKAMPLDDLVAGIRQAHRKGMLIPPQVADTVRQAFQPAISLDQYDLTTRQLEVLQLMRGGYSQKKIAEALFISPNTVNKHQQDIYRKLGVHSAGEAIALAFPERGRR